MRLTSLAFALGVMVGTASGPATAGDWPNRPLTMLYPFTAGSAGDGVGRILAARMAEILGQPVLFENAGGAGGMTGASRVARAEPDGYLFLLGGTFMVVNQTMYRQPAYNAVNDFAPVALLVDQPTILIGRKDLPANNIPELIAYAKANGGKIQYGSAGIGSVTHLSCMLLTSAIHADVTHVPYRGGGGAMQDLLGGRIDYQCPILPCRVAAGAGWRREGDRAAVKGALGSAAEPCDRARARSRRLRCDQLVWPLPAEEYATADRAEAS